MFRNITVINEWSGNNSIHCSERQKRILADVWPALKEDGTLIYSTCTFNPDENEENIKWLVGKYETVCERIDVTGFHGIMEIDYQGIYGYGFSPDKVRGEGFFISVIRKTGKQEKNLIRIKKNNYLPSSQLALSTQLRKDSFPGIELDLNIAVSYLRRDKISFIDMPKGWNIVSYKGVNLGFVNNLGNRTNNYFPVEWRIRMSMLDDAGQKIIGWSNDFQQS